MDIFKNSIGALGIIDSKMVDRVLDKDTLRDKFFGLLRNDIGFDLNILIDYLGESQTLEMLDVLSGSKITFPDYKKLSNMCMATLVHEYYVSLGRDEHNIKYIAKKFGISVPNARAYIQMLDENYNPSNETNGSIEVKKNYSEDNCVDYEEYEENYEDDECTE